MVKGQASIEFMVIVGIVMILMIPVIWYAFSIISAESQDSNAINKASTSVSRIVTLADSVGVTGQGSAIYTEIILPENINNVTVESREFFMTMQTVNGLTDITGISKFTLIGENIERLTLPGTYKLHIESINSTHVEVRVV